MIWYSHTHTHLRVIKRQQKREANMKITHKNNNNNINNTKPYIRSKQKVKKKKRKTMFRCTVIWTIICSHTDWESSNSFALSFFYYVYKCLMNRTAVCASVCVCVSVSEWVSEWVCAFIPYVWPRDKAKMRTEKWDMCVRYKMKWSLLNPVKNIICMTLHTARTNARWSKRQQQTAAVTANDNITTATTTNVITFLLCVVVSIGVRVIFFFSRV